MESSCDSRREISYSLVQSIGVRCYIKTVARKGSSSLDRWLGGDGDGGDG